jgi:hypothetical protein
VLKTYDRPLDEIVFDNGKLTSEVVIRRSNGCMARYPLVIEDCIDSVRAPQDLPFHMKHFCHWDWHNYSLSDLKCESPLASLTTDKAWKDYPFKLTDTSTETSKGNLETRSEESEEKENKTKEE